MHVDVVFTNHSFEYPDIFGITYLDDQVSAPFLNISHEYMVPILIHPNHMGSKPCDWVTTMTLLLHGRILSKLKALH